jgi:hypothetical protein
MENVKAKTAVEALSESMLAVRFEDLDDGIVENAKNRIIDAQCGDVGAKRNNNRLKI